MKKRVTHASNRSSNQKNVLAIATKTSTISVVLNVSSRVGQNTLRSSTRASSTNCQKLRPYCEKANTRTATTKAPNIATQLAQTSGRLFRM